MGKNTKQKGRIRVKGDSNEYMGGELEGKK